MSLKGKLATIAASKIASTVLNRDSLVDDKVNNVLTKLNNTGQKTTAEQIQQSKKNCLIIKAMSCSSVIGLFTGEPSNIADYLGRYLIYDTAGNLKYKSAVENAAINLYDVSNCKFGSVKEHFISVGVPFFEKDVKKCSVYLGAQKIAVLKKYVSYGDLNIDTLDGSVKITYNKDKTFKINYKSKLIATLHDVSQINLKNGYVDKYVMEYADTSNEVVAVLLATAIDFISN